jgi:Tol biopolymer transport system component
MDPQRWAKIESLYHAALAMEPSERPAYLADACEESGLRREVESLLAYSDAKLETPVAPRHPLPSGFRLGSYEIKALLGVGGMGEVYRARDTKLKRDVALKVLPGAFARDPDRMARFQREAEVLASLNHPNIAQIYGVEERALVMELVEGEPPRGPMAFDNAWKIAVQIAEALEYAHERGVVHRDLKPANVKITPDGVVKLLDFGLAKAFAGPRKASQPAGEDSLTLTISGTNAGVILGTAPYMAPEQARGKKVEKSADIWSWGAVLYELLTGERMFKGEDVADTLAQVLTQEPDLDRVPVKVRKLLRRCLEKDPTERLRHIGDVRDLLEETALAQPRNARRLAIGGWTVAGLLLIALATVSFFYLRHTPLAVHVARYIIPAPENTTDLDSFAISPDGRYLALAAEVNGKRQLWLRAMDALQAQPLPSTEGARYPFWSPDNRNIGFFAEGKLKRIAVGGGPSHSLCDAPAGRGGSWNQENVIVFSPNPIAGTAIQRVSAAGGVPADVTTKKGVSRFPVFLPNGHHFLYLVTGGPVEQNGVYLGSLDGTQNRRILAEESSVLFASGWLFFIRENTLMAQPFDDASGQLMSEALPFAEGISLTPNTYYARVTVSETGVLLYERGRTGTTNQMVWYDRSGKFLSAVGAPGPVLDPAILGGKWVVFRRLASSGADLWLWDLTRGSDQPDQRLTTDASLNAAPFWSPQGDKIAFTSNRGGGVFNLYQKAAGGTAQEELLLSTGNHKGPTQWSRDGRFIIYSEFDPKTKRDIWVLPMEGGTERKPVPFLRSEFDELFGQISPDSHWMAYTSDESGQREVYVRPFPAAEGQWKTPIGRGEQPRWRGDSQELFFVGGDGKMMAVGLKSAAGSKPFFESNAPQPLFEVQLAQAPGGADLFEYDVTSDGKLFLLDTIVASSGAAPPLTVVLNWDAGLKRYAGASGYGTR